MPKEMKYIGKEMRRVDGVAKVTGAATYVAEFEVPGLTYAAVVQSTIARGTITSIATDAAERAGGVLKIFTHENTPQPVNNRGWRALGDNKIVFSGQPIALVVAETFEQARFAARLLDVKYAEEKPSTAVDTPGIAAAFANPERRMPSPRGNPEAAMASAPVKISAEYTIPIEHHTPMEPHGGIAVWTGDKLKFYDKTQGVYSVRDHLAGLFGIPGESVEVVSHFVGGAFGSALRPNYYPWLTAMAAR
ncbi:MAG: molybdopterin cofactor-binding domain-containing protein, partial [Armatimonadota bacterium]